MYFGLLVFTVAVFGLSFIITQSFLTESFRCLIDKGAEKLQNVPILRTISSYTSYMLNCIVCASVWIAIALMALGDHSIVISNTLPDMLNPGDIALLVGWSAGSTAVLAKLIGAFD